MEVGNDVRRYAHMSVKHLQPCADQLIIPVTQDTAPKCPERLNSPGHKIGHSESRPRLRLVAGLDISV